MSNAQAFQELRETLDPEIVAALPGGENAAFDDERDEYVAPGHTAPIGLGLCEHSFELQSMRIIENLRAENDNLRVERDSLKFIVDMANGEGE